MAMARNKNVSPRDAKTEVRGPMKTDVFGLKNEDYFNSPLKNLSAVREKLEDEEFEGLLLGGPDYVPLTKDAKFPVVVLQATDAREAALHAFSDYTLLTAMDIRLNRFYVQMAMEQKYVKRERDPNQPLPEPGRSTDGGAAELFARLDMPKTEGEYLVTALLLHNVSNRLPIKVGHPDLEKNPKRFEEMLSAQHSLSDPSSKAEPVHFASMKREALSPAIPEVAGIALVVEPRSIHRDTKKPAMVFASYNLPLDFVPSAGEREADKSGFERASVYFLSTGSSNPRPFLKKLVLSATVENRKPGEASLRGYFSIELHQIGRIGKGRNHLYAFSGREMSGPVEIDLEGN